VAAARPIARLVEVFLPGICCECGVVLAALDRGLCASCWSEAIPSVGRRCPVCGGENELDEERCLSCIEAPPPQEATEVWGEHSGTLRRALLQLKHHRRDEIAVPLGDRLAAQVALAGLAEQLDLVTAVPSHPIHRVRRGWAAAELLGRVVARRLEVPFSRLLSRRGAGRQARRTRAGRRELGRRAFVARRRLGGLTVLLVDDVTTTGTTLRRAAQALLTAGAASVRCAVVTAAADPRRMA